jgi:hypothetical protein
LSLLGTNALEFYDNNFTAFNWTDGLPTPSASGVANGVFITGVTNGFQITAPADPTPRQLKVYVGLYGATSTMQAYLSDFSAMAYRDASLTNVFGNSYAVYTFDYAAAGPGQQLVVRYQSAQLFDVKFGNVTFQAATLAGDAAPDQVTLTDPRMREGAIEFSFLTRSNRTYTVLHGLQLGNGIWDAIGTVTGTGGWVTVTNQTMGNASGFFRVSSE